MAVPLILLVSLASAAYFWFKPRQFRTEALLLVRNERAQTVIGPTETGQTAPPSPVTENVIRTEAELLQSRQLLAEAAEQAGLLGAKGTPPSARGARLDAVAKSLRVSPLLKSDMIRLEYFSDNHAEGARFLRTLLNVYQERHIDLRGRGDVRLFQDEADRLNQAVREKERELSEFLARNDIHLLGEQKSLLLHRIVDTESALRLTELQSGESLERGARLGAAINRLPARVVTIKRRIPNQYTVERLQTLLVELENKRIELLSKYLENDRLVVQNGEQIRLTKSALADAMKQTSEEEATDLNPSRQSLEGDLLRSGVDAAAASRRASVLSTQLAGYRRELRRVESLTARHDDLTRQFNELADRYKLHARKSEEARIEAALDRQRVSNVVVAQEPVEPLRPEPRPLLAAIGLWAVGSVLSVAAVAVWSAFRGVFFSGRGLEDFTGIPVVGTVPRQKESR